MEAVLIDRDSAARRKLQGYLSAQGLRVAGEANDLASGLHMVRSLRQGLLILELPANPAEALETVRRLRSEQPGLGIIVNAKEVSPDLILRSMRAGAHEFLARPLDMGELSEAMERLSNAMTVTQAANAPSMGGKIFTLFSAKG